MTETFRGEKLDQLVHEKQKFGVLGHRIENNHYVVDIRWKDGHETEEHFPVKGFPVVNPKTKEVHNSIEGKRALKILEENADKMTAEEFSWLNFSDIRPKR
ncbi:MAG TPA: hypothetical protein VJC06_02060 [Candidatus Paceibacterota bacterium]